jgi:LmbE family N-acetylglucosaminyl deacetylase
LPRALRGAPGKRGRRHSCRAVVGRSITFFLLFFTVFLLFFTVAVLPIAWAQAGPDQPLAPDTGSAALKLELLRLGTTARMLHTTAHPDDEDGGMLVLESRGLGVATELLTLTRGEGGQNRVGSNLFDELGALRTLELLASDRYYGVEQRFTRAVDFGFSKTAEESFEKWGGQRGPVLGDMVREIRRFRPDVIASRFQGSPRDGHGHHLAAAIFTREAFRAAADPKMFPEQIRAGLAPWQAKKLYVGNVLPQPAKDGRVGDPAAVEGYTLALDTSVVDPALGMSYQQFAMQGLRHQLSQGAADFTMRTDLHYYRLVDSTLSPQAKTARGSGGGTSDAREQDFFDGIDTALPALAERLGGEETKLPQLKQQLAEIAAYVAEADKLADRDPQMTLPPLLKGYELLRAAMAGVEAAELKTTARQDVLVNLATKAEQFERAIKLASGIEIKASLDEHAPNSKPEGTVVPGDSFTFSVRVELPPTASFTVANIEPVLPAGWSYRRRPAAANPPHHAEGARSGDPAARFAVTIPRDAEYTRPYYHRDSSEQSLYMIDEPDLAGLPLTPPPVRVKVTCRFRQGSVDFVQLVEAEVHVGETIRRRPLVVVPAASIMLEPVAHVIPETTPTRATTLAVSVRGNVERLRGGALEVHAPEGWKVEPASQMVKLAGRNSDRIYHFRLLKREAAPGRYRLRATLSFEGKHYDQGFSVVTREDLGAIYYYQPAAEDISLVDVKISPKRAVGYIMGAGDEIPKVLKEIGMKVSMIAADELARGDLSHYGTIITGIRAYDVREDARRYNARLLDYVHGGGTLIVQYNTGVAAFNAGRYTPYPAELGRERVTEEQSPVQVLAPNDKIFHTPNEITASDFDGWIQERGLYFMHSWDDHWEPLLAMHDRGEAPLKGGLLRCVYGRGTYIYTGLSFFRELPGGVAGAVRLFVNLVDDDPDEQSSPGAPHDHPSEQSSLGAPHDHPSEQSSLGAPHARHEE